MAEDAAKASGANPQKAIADELGAIIPASVDEPPRPTSGDLMDAPRRRRPLSGCAGSCCRSARRSPLRPGCSARISSLK